MTERAERVPAGPPLRICFVMLHHARNTQHRTIREYLSATPIHSALPEALALLGHDVHLVHQFAFDVTTAERGIHYHFVREWSMLQRLSRRVGQIRHDDAALYEPAVRTINRVRSLHPDILHVHGATLNLNLRLLFQRFGRDVPPTLLHYHGGYPAHSTIGRRWQRFNFAQAQRYAFTTHEQTLPFIEAGILWNPERIVPLVETSSTFRRRERESSRQQTRMYGDPVCLSVGRLHPIKDPLTMLRGFEQSLAKRPDAQLYLYYLTDEERPVLASYLAARPVLCEHVHFRGRAPSDGMEAIYNSADFLLQASRREFSGCAILEAMACGTIPIVTDIPAFRVMTADGRFGRLFPVGDAGALAAQITAIPRDSIADRSLAIRAHFERALSFGAMARRLVPVYRDMLAERRDQA